MIDLGLVVARLLHYTAGTTLAGVSFFPLYAYALYVKRLSASLKERAAAPSKSSVSTQVKSSG